ncbi:monovalent cation/H+ antiporter complex subunit F [Actinoallomurus acaciae]|uniref:Monovalent cation/H+ antiporter complex subunit F n=1 Tax=Actinoallomurus acaciae TaxID=502577 RepID=A0ABV5YSS9_9ACTN
MTLVIDVLLVMLTAAMGIVIWRAVRGPTDADRLIAVDLGFVVFVAATALLAADARAHATLALVLVVTLVGFLATVAIALLLEGRTP